MSVHLVTIQVENFKRVLVFRVTPTPKGLTVIGGANGSGKTTVLDAIVYALGGEKRKPSEAKNRDSKKPPHIRLELSNGLIVTRQGKNSSLTVTDPKGLRGGQGVLEKFVEALALDLPKFMQANTKEKAKTLLKIIGVGDKLDELDEREKALIANRLIAGREFKSADGALDHLVEPEDPGEQPVSMAALIDEIGKANDLESTVESLRLECTDNGLGQQGAKDRIKELKEKIATNQATLTRLSGERVALDVRINDIKVPDVGPLKEKLANAETTNERVRETGRYLEMKADAEEKRLKHDGLEKSVEKVRSERQELLASAKMPLDDLTLENGELVYKGSKWDGMSSADQLKVAAGIAMSLNPKCGFVLIDKLEQMDLETLEEFGKWAETVGIQIIATRVSTGKECSIIIEDGRVKDAKDQEE